VATPAPPTRDDQPALLDQLMARFRLSGRAYHRVLKVARTIADLEGSDAITTPHLSEAISYRTLDRLLVK
jgi:magnesium chelatase family protein